MMKKAWLIIAAVLMIAPYAHASGSRIAYVDVQSVFEKTVLGKKYQDIVRGYYESRKQILDADAEEIQKLQDENNKLKAAKPRNDAAQKETEEKLSRKIAEFEKIRAEFGNEVSAKNDELSTEFNRQMQVVLKDLLRKENVSIILNKTVALAKLQVPAVLAADDELDLTDKVVQEMDRKESARK